MFKSVELCAVVSVTVVSCQRHGTAREIEAAARMTGHTVSGGE